MIYEKAINPYSDVLTLKQLKISLENQASITGMDYVSFYKEIEEGAELK